MTIIPNEKRKIVLIICLFIIFLTGSRILWLNLFNNTDQPHAVKGQMDLRNWNFNDGHALTLDGEWEFYPYNWLVSEEKHIESTKNHTKYIQVPKGWSSSLQEGERSPYGYGTYRLKLLVNPEANITYSIRVPSVRSSSVLYVNGRPLAKSGEIGEVAEKTVARNVPYTASFEVNGHKEIEIIVQASNYKDPRDGGIVRSIKLGKEDILARETQLSINMQQLVAVVFTTCYLFHYFIFVGNMEERRLLYFSLLSINSMFYFLLGSEDKLLSYWFPISYDWAFKLVHLSMIGIGFSLLQCIKHWLPRHVRKYIRFFSIFCAIASLLTIVLPTRYVVINQGIFIMILGIPIVITILTVIRESIKEIKSNIFYFCHFSIW